MSTIIYRIKSSFCVKDKVYLTLTKAKRLYEPTATVVVLNTDSLPNFSKKLPYYSFMLSENTPSPIISVNGQDMKLIAFEIKSTFDIASAFTTSNGPHSIINPIMWKMHKGKLKITMTVEFL